MLSRSGRMVLAIMLCAALVLSMSCCAVAKTVSEPVAAPADGAVVFQVRIGGATVEYTWGDISGKNEFPSLTATYAAKINDELSSQEWTGVALAAILNDASQQLGMALNSDYLVKVVAADNWAASFTVGEALDAANRYLLAPEAVKNYDETTAYANSYARILRGDATMLPNQANIRCVASVEILNADGSALGALVTPAAKQVTLSRQALIFNGRPVELEAYNIDGSNYLKLRDIAALLNGTADQFEVSFDAATRVMLAETGKPYTAVGGELAKGADQSATCQASAWTLQVNGVAKSAYVYNLGGNNFFKLRDLGAGLGFRVEYDAAANSAVIISTDYQAPVEV